MAEFTRSIQTRASTLRKTGTSLILTGTDSAAPSLKEKSPVKTPQTKPKPVRNYEQHKSFAGATSPPPVVSPFKPASERSVYEQKSAPELPTISKQPANESTKPKGKPSFSAGVAATKKVATKLPPPPAPKRNSSLPQTQNETAVSEYYDDEEAYDDIQSLFPAANGKPAQSSPLLSRTDNSLLMSMEPPPLPNRNPMPSGPPVRKSSSTEKLSKTAATGSRESSYSTNTLPLKNRMPAASSTMLRKPINLEAINPPAEKLMSAMPASSYKEVGGHMGLTEFVQKHQNRFPLPIKMCSSHTGAITVNEGDVYNVHFLKVTDVVNITASNGSAQYVVPLNSAVQFGVLYNPTNKSQDAIQGFVFATAGEIMSTGLVPPIMLVQQSCEISSQDGSVQAGDLLVINEVKQKILRSKMLMCTDVRTEQKKRLSENCAGHFSTTPSHTKLYLPQLLRHIPLPQYCVLFYDGMNAKEITSKLPGGTIEITRMTSQQSIIVSRQSTGELFEFPLSNSIVVQALQPADNVMKQLIEDTKQKHQNFKPANVNSTSMMLSLENPYTMNRQVMLFSCTRKDEKALIGIKLELPKICNSHNELDEPNPNDDPDYQLPQVAFAEYEAAKKFSPPSQQSHYDSPKSNVLKTVTKTTDEDDDVYDIPCVPNAADFKITPPAFTKPLPATEKRGDSPLLQKEIDALKDETRFLRGEVEKLHSMTKTMNASLGELIQCYIKIASIYFLLFLISKFAV